MSKESSSSGIGFFGLLAVAFIVLKLCKVIDWSWWWVTAPIWAPIPFVIAILVVVAYYEAKAERARELREAEQRRGGKSSRFMQKLQQAIDEQDAKKK
jgi:hypothetical protein